MGGRTRYLLAAGGADSMRCQRPAIRDASPAGAPLTSVRAPGAPVLYRGAFNGVRPSFAILTSKIGFYFRPADQSFEYSKTGPDPIDSSGHR